MYVKQISVFMENVAGRLEEIARVLSSENINIISLSIADTNEFGIARFIVSDPEKGCAILKDKGFTARLSDVLAVAIENKPGALEQVLKNIGNSGAGIDYLYVLSNTPASSSMVIKVDDIDKIKPYIEDGSIKVLTDEVYSLQ